MFASDLVTQKQPLIRFLFDESSLTCHRFVPLVTRIISLQIIVEPHGTIN